LGRQSGERRAYCTNAETAKAAESHQVSGKGDCVGEWGYAPKSQRPLYSDIGTAARFFQQVDYALEQAEPFFYCAKASRRERDAGLEAMPLQATQCAVGMGKVTAANWGDPEQKVYERHTSAHCSHPTVKPIALARYLATLLLPPAEYAPRRILVPFAGVFSEAIGASLAGWEEVVGVEAEEEYVTMGKARAAHWLMQPAFMMAEAAE
jgi:site-specific DNA-methyltransferase (adenine-specific)